ncbi:MAG: MFS transporter [Myxococcaceae bacterium]
MRFFNKKTMPAMLGAGIEYYDLALYGYLAPVLAPVFFPSFKLTTAYFFYFSIEFFSSIIQILGAQWFGRMGDRIGRKKALYSSMLGTSLVTGFMSLIPGYAQLGFFATALFILARISQSFFLGGEYNGGAIYCLEHEKNTDQHGYISGVYCAFTVIGILCASAIATLVYAVGSSYFRVAYLLSFIFAICTLRWRTKMRETPEYEQAQGDTTRPIFVTMMTLVIASVFVGLLHGIPSRVFNALLPIQTGIDQKTLMLINTLFLSVYTLLMVLFGYFSDRVGARKVMFTSALTTALLSYPLFVLIKTNELSLILFVKSVYVILAAAFAGPFHALAQSMFSVGHRYVSISTCYACGKCISTLTIALSFLLYEKTGSIVSISGILIFLSLVAMVSLRRKYV